MSAWTIFLAILVFSVIILFHEFGHFIVAKWNKVKVLEFSLGMGPALVSWVKTSEGRKNHVFEILRVFRRTPGV